MLIGELSKRTGASVRSLRYYERKGLISGARTENGYRDFGESQVERVRAVQFYLGLGLSTDQMGRIFDCQDKQDTPLEDPGTDVRCESLLLLYERKLEQIEGQIGALCEARERLKDRIALFKEHEGKARVPPG